jgi:large subunit ribosomal protein L19
MAEIDSKLREIEKDYLRNDLPDFGPGDVVIIYTKIIEGGKERVQPFKGVVLRKRGAGTRATFTVRKISYGIGVERIFSLNSPYIQKIEVVSRGRVRRARLYYLRKYLGRQAKVKEKKSY